MAFTNEHKKAILEQRIQQMESELYQHELNKSTAELFNAPVNEVEVLIEQTQKIIDMHKELISSLSE